MLGSGLERHPMLALLSLNSLLLLTAQLLTLFLPLEKWDSSVTYKLCAKHLV